MARSTSGAQRNSVLVGQGGCSGTPTPGEMHESPPLVDLQKYVVGGVGTAHDAEGSPEQWVSLRHFGADFGLQPRHLLPMFSVGVPKVLPRIGQHDVVVHARILTCRDGDARGLLDALLALPPLVLLPAMHPIPLVYQTNED